MGPSRRFLYLVQEDGSALRYGCGVGKAGFDYQGAAVVGRKATWPRWTPTPNMIKLEPERYGHYAGGVEGGLRNPLGARALYLYCDGRDTLYRIHGTHEPDTIGHSVSSGCIRLFNQDIVDLHRRMPVGTSVTVPDADAAGRGATPGRRLGSDRCPGPGGLCPARPQLLPLMRRILPGVLPPTASTH